MGKTNHRSSLNTLPPDFCIILKDTTPTALASFAPDQATPEQDPCVLCCAWHVPLALQNKHSNHHTTVPAHPCAKGSSTQFKGLLAYSKWYILDASPPRSIYPKIMTLAAKAIMKGT